MSDPVPAGPDNPGGDRRAAPEQERGNSLRDIHLEDQYAREIMERARDGWPNCDDDDQDER